MRLRFGRSGRVADDRIRPRADVAVERHVRGQPGRRHTRNRPRLLEQPLPEHAPRRRVRRSGSPAGRFARSARRSAENPGLTAWSRAKLLIRSPAPTRSIRASAVSPMTSVAAREARWPGSPIRASLSSLRNDDVLPRMTATAGTRPKTRPVRTESASVNSSTAGCSDASAIPGSWRELSATSAADADHPARGRPLLRGRKARRLQ